MRPTPEWCGCRETGFLNRVRWFDSGRGHSRLSCKTGQFAGILSYYDLYGKLMPGSEAEAAALVDAYLGTEAALREEQHNSRIVL
jgi:hypothetical protein